MMGSIQNISFDRKTVFFIFLGFFHIFNFTTSIKVESITPAAFQLSEGPHWDVKSQKLYFVDILAQNILRLDPATGAITSAYLKGGPVSIAIPVEGTVDKLIVGCGRDVVIVTWNGESNVTDPGIEKLVSVDTDRTDTRTSDGKCDAAGRLWIGTIAFAVNKVIPPNRAALYTVGNDASLKKVLSPVTVSNGLTWSLQNDVFYYIDTDTYQISGFDYDNTNGSITNKRVIFDLKQNNVTGRPDGMTIDTDGNLWVALYNGGAVIQVNPKLGKLLRTVNLPVDKVTSVAFGGAELDILFVTTAYLDLTDEERQRKPESGSLFTIKDLGVKGIPPNNFVYKV